MTDVLALLWACARSLSVRDTISIDYLEVGVQEGHSLEAILTNPYIRLAVGIDTWGGEAGGTSRGSPDHIPMRLGKEMRRVVIITGDSHIILPGLRHTFDLIFVDGDHSQAGCLKDCESCLKLLSQNGTLFVDDMDHPQHSYLRGAVTKWAEDKGLCIEFHKAGYGVAEIWMQR